MFDSSSGVAVVSNGKSEKSVVREYVEAIVIAVLLALFIRSFVVQAFKIPSGSMLSTLQIGDHLLVNKFIYGVKLPVTGTVIIPIKKPARGDIVVFKYPKDRSTDYIKRVVGVAGDTIEIKNKQVYINGQAVENSHIQFTDKNIMKASAGPRDNMGPVKVPENSLFMMGDNRDNSYDSRFWGFVPLKDVLGKAFILYWSWDLQKPLLSVDRFTSIRWSRIGDIVH
ncbi:MAG: signal peptidase I [Desulfocapsa sp.]|nr:MAG: signal peptidase I [Desulfocapsa sp.]